MKLTAALKAYAIAKLGVKQDAGDDVFRAELGKAIIAGTLGGQELADLSADKPDAKTLVAGMIDERVGAHLAPIAATLAAIQKAMSAPQQPAAAVAVAGTPAAPPVTPAAEKGAAPTSEKGNGTPRPEEVLGQQPGSGTDVEGKGMDEAMRIRVKGIKDLYGHTPTQAICPEFTRRGSKHLFAGRPAKFGQQQLHNATDLMKAVAGMYFKWSLQSQLKAMGDYPRWMKWTQHDQDILNYALHECQWSGLVHAGPEFGLEDSGGKGYKLDSQRLSEQQRKDLLDDSTSGGINAVPIYFDEMMVLTPVLYGELFPLVEVVNMTRGRLIDGSSMSNPTFTSGTAEGTAITPFSTTGFIAGMDSTVFPVVSAVNIGLDFEEDSPADIGGTLVMKFGEKLMEWLDNQIANGDGTTEMQGFFNAASTIAVPSDNGTGGPATVGDYEALLFGMNKAFRRANGGRVAFVANDTTYSRAKAIAVGPNDERRVFGMNHQDYTILETPYKVQNDIANNLLAFVNLGGYRLYRRLGMSVRIETGGSTLARANEKLIVVRGRFAGRLTLGGYASIMTDAES